MKFPCSHKTVIVLDHGPQFAQPCHSVEFDVQRARGNQMYSLHSRVFLLNSMYSGPEVIKCTVCTAMSFC